MPETTVQKNDRRDHHLDQFDKAVAERLYPVRRRGMRREPAEQGAEENGEENLDIELLVKRWPASGGGRGVHGVSW